MTILKRFTFATLAALAVTLLFQTPIMRAEDRDDRDDHRSRVDDNRFVILLSGVYKPVTVGHGPKGNLGLTTMDLNDGSFIKVKIYPVGGLRGDTDEDKAIGTFYVRKGGDVCAYDLPGGSFSAKFNFATGAHFTRLPPGPPTGLVSWTLDGTFELDILEATGIYQPFADGHIHMVDILKFRVGDGTLLEDCFCHIHPRLVAP